MPRASISLFSFQTVQYYEWYLLSSSHCRDLGHLTLAHSSRPSRNLSAQYPDSKFSAFFTEVEDQIAEFVIFLMNKIVFRIANLKRLWVSFPLRLKDCFLLRSCLWH